MFDKYLEELHARTSGTEKTASAEPTSPWASIDTAMRKAAGDMPPFLEQDRPKKVKEIYSALKRDHPDMPAEMKARIAARQGKRGKQHQGPPYKGPLTKEGSSSQGSLSKEATRIGFAKWTKRARPEQLEKAITSLRGSGAGMEQAGKRGTDLYGKAMAGKSEAMKALERKRPWKPDVPSSPEASSRWEKTRASMKARMEKRSYDLAEKTAAPMTLLEAASLGSAMGAAGGAAGSGSPLGAVSGGILGAAMAPGAMYRIDDLVGQMRSGTLKRVARKATPVAALLIPAATAAGLGYGLKKLTEEKDKTAQSVSIPSDEYMQLAREARRRVRAGELKGTRAGTMVGSLAGAGLGAAAGRGIAAVAKGRGALPATIAGAGLGFLGGGYVGGPAGFSVGRRSAITKNQEALRSLIEKHRGEMPKVAGVRDLMLSSALGATAGAIGSLAGSTAGVGSEYGEQADIPNHVLRGALAGALVAPAALKFVPKSVGLAGIAGGTGYTAYKGQKEEGRAFNPFAKTAAASALRDSRLWGTMAGAVTGAGLGYATDDENRAKGALIGAGVGAGVGGFLGALGRSVGAVAPSANARTADQWKEIIRHMVPKERYAEALNKIKELKKVKGGTVPTMSPQGVP